MLLLRLTLTVTASAPGSRKLDEESSESGAGLTVISSSPHEAMLLPNRNTATVRL